MNDKDINKLLTDARRESDEKFDDVRKSIMELKLSYTESMTAFKVKMQGIVFVGVTVGSTVLTYIVKQILK